jgi:hypothetical protein
MINNKDAMDDNMLLGRFILILVLCFFLYFLFNFSLILYFIIVQKGGD